MNGKIGDFARQIETAHWRVASLKRHAGESLSPAAELLPSAFEELQAAFEELRVAQEEMLQQQRALLATRAQVEAEQQRYRDLFEFAPDAYLVTTASGMIREANRAAADLLGMPPPRLVGSPLALFVADYARRAFRNDVRRLRQATGPQRWELIMQAHGGAPFDAALTVAPIHDWSGIPAGLRWMVRDISERKQAEERIRTLNEQLKQRVIERTTQLEAVAAEKATALEHAREARAIAEQAVRDREAFMATVAHELKGPLTAIIGYSQLLQRRVIAGDTLKSRDLRGLRTIIESAQQLTNISELLQDVAQIEAGVLSTDRAPLDLTVLVQETISMLHKTLTCHSLDLRCADGPVVVEGDKLRLQQVVLNLLQNAITYSPARTTITVVVEPVGDQARLAVHDHGISVPTMACEQLFERFSHAGNADPPHGRGTGIDLYMVKEIVTLHSGQIEVDSAIGGGSTCTVWLPLAPDKAV
ncbi:MAG: ATP-binding protein [Roseiflexaceae bacterium]